MSKSEAVALILLAVILFLILVLELFFLLVKLRKGGYSMRQKKAASIVNFLAIFLLVCFLYAYFIEPRWIQVNTITISTKKLKSTSFKIVQISDFHSDRQARNERRLVKIVNAFEPDVIVFTGDTINEGDALGLFKETMKGMNAKLAKLAVRGNWDAWYWAKADLFGDTGFQELNRTTAKVVKNNEEIDIIGTGSYNTLKYKKIFKEAMPDKFNVFLYHSPDLIEAVKDLPVDLYLAGHTHGGQVKLPFYGAVVTLSRYGKKYESGFYRIDPDTRLYVNRGIGTEGGPLPPVRFLSRPEVAVFIIQPEK